MRCSRRWRVSSRRRQSRWRARAYLLGLLSQAERKNGWTIAEFAGDSVPGRDAAAAELLRVGRGCGPGCVCPVRGGAVWVTRAAVLVADESGFVKKGRMSAGVQRQYTGTAGRVENAPGGGVPRVCRAGTAVRALIDRELYLPESWTGDRPRCREAGIGDDVEFATKPELARQMIERAVAAGVPFAGSPPMRSTARTRTCGPGWKPRRSAT